MPEPESMPSYVDVLELIIAVISGGLVTALVTHLLQTTRERKSTERAHLDSALREVYAPVTGFLRECAMLFDQSRRIHKEYSEYFNQRWDESAWEGVMEQARATIETANLYCERAIRNVDEVVQIANRSWHLIDMDDVPVFDEIRLARTRTQVEYNTAAGKKIPFILAQNLGAPSFFDSKWLASLESSYDSKLARYRQLSGFRRKDAKKE